MARTRYSLRFPQDEPHTLTQDQAYFTLEAGGETVRLRFHDYAQIYGYEGLYEQLFYDRLKCVSPQKVVTRLKERIDDAGGVFSELRVLDAGAGNGMVGALLAAEGVARIVGLDISDAARAAAERDRPGVYDAYCVADLAHASEAVLEDLRAWRFNAMTCVAALGFGDMPPEAFAAAYGLVEVGGWIAFNIKETFLDNRDSTGFSVMIKQAIAGEYLDLHLLERYRHRLSVDGAPLYYFAVIARKAAEWPRELWAGAG